MVGREDGGKRVLGCYKTVNMNRDRAYDRYQISADEHYRIDKQARDNQLSIIGFYHSHPNSPPYPSAYDAQAAWPIYSYLIISVDESKNTLIKSWVLADQERKLVAEEISQI
jgi:proteasome lid subunit RPN8/RPN11